MILCFVYLQATSSDETDVAFRSICPDPLSLKCMSSESGNGFTLLGDIEPASSEFLSHQLRVQHTDCPVHGFYKCFETLIYTSSIVWHYFTLYSVSQKKSPLRTCGNFSKTDGNFSTKFYTPIVRSCIRKTMNFYSINLQL